LKKFITIVFVLAIMGAAAWYFLRDTGTVQSPYRFVSVERGGLESVVSTTGTLEAVTTVEVGTQVSGIISEIFVDFNDTVRKGQVIARLDTTLLESAVRDAEANLERNEAQLRQAEREYARIEGLYEKEIVAENEFNSAQYDLEVARAGVKSANVALEKARQNLAYATVYAPIAGTVIERNVDVGQTVASSLSTPQLFLIADDLSKMQILASVDESDIGKIEEGQTGRFTVQAYPDDSFEGTVRQVRLQSKVEENVVNYTVVVDVENPDGTLLPGMTAMVDFLVETVSGVLKVPNAALRFRATEEMFAEARQRMQARREGRQAESGAAGRQQGEGRGAGGERPERVGGGMPGGERPGGMGGGRPGGGMGGMMDGMMSGGQMADGMALLWYLDEEGNLAMAPVRTGISDGQSTEIIGRQVEEGMQVIAGVTKSESSGGSTNPFQSQNQQPGPGGPPRGGF
jgi:HlyD family secretion protein